MKKQILIAVFLLSLLTSFNLLQAQSLTPLQQNGETLLTDNFESGDFSHFLWVNDATNAWSVVSTNDLQGQKAARSATPTYSGTPSTSTLTLNVDFDADAALKFRWYAPGASYYYGTGTFSIDGTLTAQYTANESSVIEVSVPLAAGSHTLTWTYNCNNPQSSDVVYPEYNYLYLDSVVFSFAPIPIYTLDGIPSNWTVTANGQTVSVTPYATPNQDEGYALIPVGAAVVLNPPDADKPRVKDITTTDPLTIPLTFEAKTAGAQVTFSIANVATNPVEYSTDGTTWTTYDNPITLTNVGDKVSFRGNNATYAINPNIQYPNYSHFSCTGQFYVYGNIMSLINSTGFATATELTGSYTFFQLFYDNSSIYNHASKALVLPATTLAEGCYYYMFKGCSSLTSAPALPAMTLAKDCYIGMFGGCTSLETAPALPATALAEYCYYSMFNTCTSLITASALPATTLANHCYDNMFINCSGLTYAPSLPATTLANNCYSYMFSGCTNLTTAPELPATTLAEYCYSGMFNNCTSLTTAPTLPATTLANYCYSYMFNGCSLLNSVTCLATNIDATGCTTNWLKNVAATGTFIKPASMNDWNLNSPDGIPTGWTPTIYEPLPLTFEACNPAVVVSFSSNVNNLSPLEYSLNGGPWTIYTSAITLTNIGDKVSFRGNNASYSSETMLNTFTSHFSCSSDCYLYGNIMSLIDSLHYPSATTLSSPLTFKNLFSYNHKLLSHPTRSLILPATSLSRGCYSGMFNLCDALTRAPELPATTLADNCYETMFWYCASLSVAPKLPAPTLTFQCYYYMFSGCTSLNSVTCFATDISASYCTDHWLKDVAATGTFVKPETMTGWTLNSPSGIPTGWTPTIYEPLPLTFEAKTAGAQVTFTKSSELSLNDLEYNVYDGNDWQTYTSGTAITLTNVGDKVSFRGNNTTYSPDDNFFHRSSFNCSKDCYIYGNIMSLIDKDNFSTATELTGNYTFSCLFAVNENIYSHALKALVLPATTLTQGCYSYMFNACPNLTQAPALPATTMKNKCYYSMFFNCSGLNYAPSLPATTLANNCYSYMFSGCTNLTTAPELPATTLAESCYSGMFSDCTHLTAAPTLPATTLVANCYNSMFQGCTSLETAPALPATTLANFCYIYMFQGCSQLNSVTCLATSGINSSNSTTDWLKDVAATGTFTKNASTPTGSGTSGQDWPTNNANGIPSGWTTSNYSMTGPSIP